MMGEQNGNHHLGQQLQSQENGFSAGAHMHHALPQAPPLAPINTNAPNPAMSPGGTALGGPMSAGGTVRRAAPEPNKRTLYVGGLDQRITEDILREIFGTTGNVTSVKIIPDKNFQSRGFNYGFVEYDNLPSAERAMQTLNGRRIHQSEIRVNWAYQSNTATKEDTSNHFHVFVGDLSNEVNDEILCKAFDPFGEVSEARVMWDMKTGRSRGYGFVAFRDRAQAEKAIGTMDGEFLGSRAIRCNWANQKGQPSVLQQQAMAQMGMTTARAYSQHQYPLNGVQNYEMILQQAPQYQTNCWVGNLSPYTTQNDIIPLFENFGRVLETRFQSDRGFAFVKMDTHENAALAICQLNGYLVNGQALKCGWGKDRERPAGQFEAYSPQSLTSPTSYYPQYGSAGGPMSPTSHGGIGSIGSPYSAPPYGANAATYNAFSPTSAGANVPYGRANHSGSASLYGGGYTQSYSGFH